MRGEVDGRPWHRRLLLADSWTGDVTPGHQGVASIWARRKIAGLLDRLHVGAEEAEVRAEVLPLALAHQLLSPYTSFVAVEQAVSRPGGEKLHSKPVPNTRPRGQTPQGFAYPSTSTTGPAKFWFGVLALFLALILRLLRQPEVDRAPAART